MSDFVTNEIIEGEVAGHKFKFKEMNGSQMDIITDNSITFVEGKILFSISEQRKGWLSVVEYIDFPEWETLNSKEEKINFLNTLKAPIRLGIIEKIKKFHEDLGDTIKK